MKTPVRSLKRQAWGVCKHACRGAFLALAVAGASQGLQLLLGDVAAWAFVGLVIAAVFMLGRKPGRTMGRIFPKS